MKKLLLIPAALLMLASCAQENVMERDPVPQPVGNPYLLPAEDAVAVARQIVANLAQENATRSAEPSLRNVQVCGNFPTRGQEEESSVRWGYYAVNFDEGFALVSADRRAAKPVVAFSDEGELNLSDTIYNKGLGEYVRAMSNPTVSWADSTKIIGFNPDPGITIFPKGEVVISPFIAAEVRKWHAYEPYNKYCLDTYNQTSDAGSGAVAMGMILSHYEWPVSHGNYDFNWSAIKSGTDIDMTARMLRILGDADKLAIIYRFPFESLHATDNFKQAFRNMGYKEPTISSTFNHTTAISTIRSRQPMIITTSANLHTWVIDGLYRQPVPSVSQAPAFQEYEYYLHTVWGWGGRCDGYFDYSSDTLSGYAEKLDTGETSEMLPYHMNSFGMVYNFVKN